MVQRVEGPVHGRKTYGPHGLWRGLVCGELKPLEPHTQVVQLGVSLPDPELKRVSPITGRRDGLSRSHDQKSSAAY